MKHKIDFFGVLISDIKMSLTDRIDETFKKLFEGVVTRQSFTEKDIEQLIMDTKQEILTVIAQDNVAKVTDVLNCVTSSFELTENMCIMPDKKIRVNV